VSSDVIAALDLSMRGLGMVAGSPSWDLDWRRIRFNTLEYKLRKGASGREEVARLRSLARDVRTWIERVKATEVWAEDIAAHQGFSVVQLSELRCAVRLELDAIGIELRFVPEMTARKTLLGWVPKNRKAHVVEVLKAQGDPFNFDDERDAFTILNHRFHDLGAPCLTALLGEKPAKVLAPPRRAG